MEYYALFYAWAETLRPWMSDASFAAYQHLHESGSVTGTLPSEWLRDLFPKLRVGDTADFNHFWLYSSLAALVQASISWMGLHLSAHMSFLVLHALLFASVMGLASCFAGWRGFVAVTVLTASSPIFWYGNKVHSEFFTYCFTLAAVILTTRNLLVVGALLMAFAATQNPGLSIVAAAMLGLRGLKGWSAPYSRWEIMAACLTVLILALHPAYYFFRHGVITPQLLSGGASPGAGISIAYIWLIDPDVGLFPNWIFGLVILVGGIVFWHRGRSSLVTNENSLWFVCGVFLVAALYSHASTENLNSGATPGLSRYALWYIPLIYPFALTAIDATSRFPLSARWPVMLLTIAMTASGLGRMIYIVNESYVSPSYMSRLLQTYVPALYDPPPEIFAERYSGLGEQPVRATVGPDCKKVLVYPEDPGRIFVTVPAACAFTASQIEPWVSAKTVEINQPSYLQIVPGDIAPQKPMSPRTIFQHDTKDEAVRYIDWSVAEAAHRWSDGTESRLKLQLPPAAVDRCLEIDGFTLGLQTVTVSVGGKVMSDRTLDGRGKLMVPLGGAEGLTEIVLSFSNPHVPNDEDGRVLAFAVETLTVGPCDIGTQMD